jgi:hypothetical protein
MQPEYDIRGGVRGKYFDRYQRGREIRLSFVEGECFVAGNTSSAVRVGAVTKVATYPASTPSPELMIGQSREPVHAG